MYITVIRPPDKLKNEVPRCWLVPRWTQGWQVQAIPAPCEILQDFLKHPWNFKLLISIYWFVIMQTPCLSAALQSKLWKVENDVEIWRRHADIRCQDIWELILAQVLLAHHSSSSPICHDKSLTFWQRKLRSMPKIGNPNISIIGTGNFDQLIIPSQIPETFKINLYSFPLVEASLGKSRLIWTSFIRAKPPWKPKE